MGEATSNRPTGYDVLAALATPVGLTGLFILSSYLLPELGCPVFLTVERRSDFSAAFFGAFALWVFVEFLVANKQLREIPKQIGVRIFWAVGMAVIFGIMSYLLFLAIVFPGTALFQILAALANHASPQMHYGARVAFDLLFAAGLALAAPGLLPLAQRLGLASGPPRENKRWIAYAALIAVGSLTIALVALIGRVNPMVFRRLFLPPVEG